MDDFIFDGEKHIYTLNGKLIPSVSEIISPLSNPIDESLENTYEVAAERGTFLHNAAMLLADKDYEIEYPEEYQGYIDGIVAFLAEHEVIPLIQEQPMYHSELLYAGTPDNICFFDGKLSIIDYKFVSVIQKSLIKAQLNGYGKILLNNDMVFEALYVVQFLPNGKYRIYPTAIDESEFNLCYEIYRARNKKHDRGVIS